MVLNALLAIVIERCHMCISDDHKPLEEPLLTMAIFIIEPCPNQPFNH